MIRRHNRLSEINGLLKRYPVVAILGARQVGKSTLARQVFQSRGRKSRWFDLEDAHDRSKLEDPLSALKPLESLVVLDEIQRRPELFPALRVLADERRSSRRFLILGSASPPLLRQSSESLAGRITYHILEGFNPEETGLPGAKRLWLRGGFPLSYLAGSDDSSFKWRKDFITAFLERDLPQFQVSIPSETLRRFWSMLAHYHGQIWNASEFARSFGVSDMTVRRYLDLLSSTFMVRQLQPWFENIGKRQVKSPKIFFLDSGLFHALSGIETMNHLLDHPRCGASWEGFVVNSLIQRLKPYPEECFFWATHTGAELDFLIVRGKTRLGFEIKRSEAPGVTPSMRSALKDLKLDRLYVIHSGKEDYSLGDRTEALCFESVFKKIRPLR